MQFNDYTGVGYNIYSLRYSLTGYESTNLYSIKGGPYFWVSRIMDTTKSKIRIKRKRSPCILQRYKDRCLDGIFIIICCLIASALCYVLHLFSFVLLLAVSTGVISLDFFCHCQLLENLLSSFYYVKKQFSLLGVYYYLTRQV